MKKRTLALFAFLLAASFVALGCGTATKPAYRSGNGGGWSPGPSAPSSTPAPDAAAEVSGSYDRGAPSPGSSSQVYQPEHRPVQERPGLGTVWGETVSSHVTRRQFIRASQSPFAAVAMHYNDEEGVRAHVGYVGGHGLEPVRARTPHGGISVALTDPYGNLLPGGDAGGRVFVVGRAGERYNIALHNHTGGRYEIVASVDGLDVIDGRPADLGKRGYILEPYGTLTIDGFRRSERAVAAFRFGRVSDSYAARTSGDRNIGVIAVALFTELGSEWTSDELYRRDTANPFPGDPSRSYAQPPSY